MSDKEKKINEIKEKMILEAIDAISIKGISEEWSNSNKATLYIKTNSLEGADMEALEEAKMKYVSNDIFIDLLMPEMKIINSESVKNNDMINILITAN